MTRDNTFLEGLAAVPVAEGVLSHSIIPVQHRFKIVAHRDAGVVRYRSAYVEAGSRVFVRSQHAPTRRMRNS